MDAIGPPATFQRVRVGSLLFGLSDSEWNRHDHFTIRLALVSPAWKHWTLFWLSDVSTGTIYEWYYLTVCHLGTSTEVGRLIFTYLESLVLTFPFLQIQWKKGHLRENEHLSYAYDGENRFGAVIPFKRRSVVLFPSERGMRLGRSTSCCQEIPVGVWGSEIGKVWNQASVLLWTPLRSEGDESQG